MICVYKIENPEGKCYIGATIDYSRRKKTYARIGQVKPQKLLYDSMMKYGFNNHVFSIVEQCEMSKLYEREQFWIKSLNTFEPNGLNRTLGGRGTKGIKMTNTTRDKLSNMYSIPVYQYDLSGNFIAEYKSAYDAQDKSNIGASDIRHCITGIRNRKTAGGFFWSERKEETFKRDVSHSSKRSVIKLSMSMDYICEYSNIKAAAKDMNVHGSNISKACRGIRPHASGFMWKFKDEFLTRI